MDIPARISDLVKCVPEPIEGATLTTTHWLLFSIQLAVAGLPIERSCDMHNYSPHTVSSFIVKPARKGEGIRRSNPEPGKNGPFFLSNSSDLGYR